MTNQNPTKTDAKTPTIVRDDEAQPANEQPEVKKELSDKEISTVAGGHTGPINGPPSGGRMFN
ncbi:MAG: hypothetical protein ACLQGP_39215 [Isosphaeraceae bacterium]